MKTRITASLLAFGVMGLAANLIAEGNARQKPSQRSPHQRPDKITGHRLEAPGRPNAKEHEQLLLLRRLIDMPPERLAMLQATIDRIQTLSPDEKRRLRERLDNFGRIPSHERHKLLEGFRHAERQRLDAFERRHKHLPPEQRDRELRRIHSLPPHERRAYFERLRRGKHPKDGLLPPPHVPPRREGSSTNPAPQR